MTGDDALKRLERQIERGSFFLHTAVSSNAGELQELAAFVHGAIDVLVAKGVASEEEIAAAVQRVRDEMQARGETSAPGIALRVDGAPNDFVPVDCAERLPICKAVCCSLNFALTAQEVESGAIKWDLGMPYFIRHESTGFCTHLAAGGQCSIYEKRPGVCRRYSCAGDTRIWKDFDQMILNEEWLAEHTGGSEPRLVAAQMIPAPE